jgi:hypothetical protein
MMNLSIELASARRFTLKADGVSLKTKKALKNQGFCRFTLSTERVNLYKGEFNSRIIPVIAD